MIKVFTTNSNGKIEITPAELEELLKQAYAEGYEKSQLESNQSLTPYYNPLRYDYDSPTALPHTYNIKTENDLKDKLEKTNIGVYKK